MKYNKYLILSILIFCSTAAFTQGSETDNKSLPLTNHVILHQQPANNKAGNGENLKAASADVVQTPNAHPDSEVDQLPTPGKIQIQSLAVPSSDSDEKKKINQESDNPVFSPDNPKK